MIITLYSDDIVGKEVACWHLKPCGKKEAKCAKCEMTKRCKYLHDPTRNLSAIFLPYLAHMASCSGSSSSIHTLKLVLEKSHSSTLTSYTILDLQSPSFPVFVTGEGTLGEKVFLKFCTLMEA